MEKNYVFKNKHTGTSKSTKKPFTMVELHDPITLENTTYFLQDGVEIPDLDSFKIKDKVAATLDIGVFNGKTVVNLLGLKKTV